MPNSKSRYAIIGGAVAVTLGLVLSFQNCAGGGGGAFNLTTSASTAANTSGTFNAGAIQLASNIFLLNSTMAASSTLSGAASNGGVYCSWQIYNSTKIAVGTPILTVATNSVCSVTTLTSPTTAGSYILTLTATNATGVVATQSTTFTAQVTLASPPTPTPTATPGPVGTATSFTTILTPSPSSMLPYSEGVISAQILATNAVTMTAVIGYINPSTSANTAICSGSVTNQTTLTVSCNDQFYNAGIYPLYVTVTVNGEVVKTCTNSYTSGCEGTYNIVVNTYYSGGGTPGGGTSGGCFIAGTKVETPQGQVAIEKIRKGDIVFAYDSKLKKTVEGTVGGVLVHKNKVYGDLELEDGTHLSVTSVHRFYLPQTHSYKAIGELKVGDTLLRGTGDDAHEVKIKSLDFKDKNKVATVYNFHVKKYMNYYVEGVLVHNVKLNGN